MGLLGDLVRLKRSLSPKSTRGFKTALVSVNTSDVSHAFSLQDLKHQHPNRPRAENNRPLLGREGQAIKTV